MEVASRFWRNMSSRPWNEFNKDHKRTSILRMSSIKMIWKTTADHRQKRSKGRTWSVSCVRYRSVLRSSRPLSRLWLISRISIRTKLMRHTRSSQQKSGSRRRLKKRWSKRWRIITTRIQISCWTSQDVSTIPRRRHTILVIAIGLMRLLAALLVLHATKVCNAIKRIREAIMGALVKAVAGTKIIAILLTTMIQPRMQRMQKNEMMIVRWSITVISLAEQSDQLSKHFFNKFMTQWNLFY